MAPERLCQRGFCAENGTRFEIECYDIGHLYTRHPSSGPGQRTVLRTGPARHTSGIGTHPEDVAHMKRTADPPVRTGSPLVGAGRRSQPLRSPPQAIAPGGNVRVGLEDWLWIGKGQLAADLTSGTEARRVKTVANWRPHYSACAWLWRRPAQHAACCQVVLCQGRPGAGRGFPQML
ncbi:MAG: 3-keto-5-aminohexanoate cleavage protein [Mesorhizobium sp.]|uniref:3-keto-5-aminohexanoate cleavage protein n=1 Tax=Mesorhizobium sp. TaxID=1871066 RepID=UPI0012025153|nr:MAG: 3-keto-5-aminohexanoate cleavage protein [Mesorhizobium sp.]